MGVITPISHNVKMIKWGCICWVLLIIPFFLSRWRRTYRSYNLVAKILKFLEYFNGVFQSGVGYLKGTVIVQVSPEWNVSKLQRSLECYVPIACCCIEITLSIDMALHFRRYVKSFQLSVAFPTHREVSQIFPQWQMYPILHSSSTGNLAANSNLPSTVTPGIPSYYIYPNMYQIVGDFFKCFYL